MKRFLSMLSGIIIGAIVILVILLFIGWSRIPDILAHHLSKEMKVSVEVEDVNLSLKSIGIEKLEIGNPKGSLLPKAFSSDSIMINAPISNYLDKQIVLDEVLLDKVYIGLEFDAPGSKSGNWTTIMGNLKSANKGEKKGKTVLIKKLILTGINLDLVYRQGGGKIQHLPPIKRMEFTNISSETGIPTQQISDIILSETLRSIFQRENLQNMIEGFMQSPSKGIENLIQPFKNFLPSQ
jgi:uncharacterized protein involved in outer membrane biogenesis